LTYKNAIPATLIVTCISYSSQYRWWLMGTCNVVISQCDVANYFLSFGGISPLATRWKIKKFGLATLNKIW